jgi:hypothetical protein
MLDWRRQRGLIHLPLGKRGERAQHSIAPLDLARGAESRLCAGWVDCVQRMQRHDLLADAMLFAVKT